MEVEFEFGEGRRVNEHWLGVRGESKFATIGSIRLGLKAVAVAVSLMAVVSLGCARKPQAAASRSENANASGESSNSRARATDSNAGGPSTSPGPAPTATPLANNGLVGTFNISEIENQGAIELIDPKKAQVTFAFYSDGSYARSTKDKEQVVHSDGGNVRFDGPDQLTLITTIENRNILKSSKTKTYKYQLSADGTELRLWGANERVAVFKKQDKKPDEKE